jgi:hypothetical protein
MSDRDEFLLYKIKEKKKILILSKNAILLDWLTQQNK